MHLRCVILLFAIALLNVASIAAELSSADTETFQQARSARQSGDHARAVELLTELRGRYPDMADLPRLLAHSYFDLKQYDRARAAAVEAIGLGRVTVDLLTRLVQIDQQREDEAAMLNNVRLLTSLDADNPTWRLMLGQLLTTTGNTAAAESVYRRLIKTSPARAELWSQLGNVLTRQQRYADAAAAYETAWRLGDRSPTLAAVLAGLHQRLDDEATALNWLQRALDRQSAPAASLRLQQAQLLHAAGQPDAAVEAATAVLDAGDNALIAGAHRLLGRIAMDRQKQGIAIEHWQQADQLGGADRPILLALGKLHHQRSEYSPARRYLARYIDTGPVDRQTLLLLARTTLMSDASADRFHQALDVYIQRFGLDDDARRLIHEAVMP